MTTRWILTDPATAETWTMPINPDQMSSPQPTRTLSTVSGTGRYQNAARLRTFMTPSAAVDWEWGGVIRSQAHHDTLRTWARKPGEVHVTDHLGRTWAVLFTRFTPVERRPTPLVPWRQRYTMNALILRRVS